MLVCNGIKMFLFVVNFRLVLCARIEDNRGMEQRNETLSGLAADVRTAIRNASYAIDGFASAKSARKRRGWRADLRSCKVKLDRASYALMMALHAGGGSGWVLDDANKELARAGQYLDILCSD